MSGTVPLTVQFTDESTAGTSPITTWDWTFGDGVTSAERNPSHTYGTAGSYSVTLRVTTADGSDLETRSNLISIYEDTTWAPDGRTFDVEMTPEVLMVAELDLEQVILQYNPEEHAYLLDPDGLAERGLDLPLVLAGIEVGRNRQFRP